VNPAFSVVLLTTLIGAGQGLFLALYSAQLYRFFDLLPPGESSGFFAFGSFVALGFLAAGLIASFSHLGRPERAWRAIAQWRTSWLSREVIVLPAFMGAVCLYGLAHALGWTAPLVTLRTGQGFDITLLAGGLGTLLAFALFLCTAMIYACIRFLQEWHTPLTVVNYTLLGGASGFTLAAALAGFGAPELVRFFAGWALILTVLGLIGRALSLIRNARLRPVSSLQTAIGVKHPQIAQKSMGFMGGSFNTREFFHGRAAGFLRSVKWVFLLLAFAIPLGLLALGMSTQIGAVLAAAFLTQYLGLLAERWFFFAQANHPQNLYYRMVG
jgi:DMSO reductase anchor subunit